jgi:hypothetical protein
MHDPDFNPVEFHKICEDVFAFKDKSSSNLPWRLKTLRDAEGEIALPSMIPREFTAKAANFEAICNGNLITFVLPISSRTTVETVTVELSTEGHPVA